MPGAGAIAAPKPGAESIEGSTSASASTMAARCGIERGPGGGRRRGARLPGSGMGTESARRSAPSTHRADSASGPGASNDEEAVPPILLVREMRGTRRVVTSCRVARMAGVRPEMTVAAARVLLSEEPWCVPHEPARDAAALEAIARWALRLAPRAARDGTDGIRLEVTGCDRLYRGEARLVNAIANSFAWLGLDVRVAVAETPGAAWALARYGDADRVVVPASETAAAIGALPVEALRLADDVADGLREVGLESIGDVLAMPRLELAERFGAAAERGAEPGGDLLRRIDEALGDRAERFDSVREHALPRAERRFDGPVRALEGIRRTVAELVDVLAAELARRESGVRRLHATFERSDLAPHHEVIVLGRPSRDAAHLRALLAPRVERLPMGWGVESVELVAAHCGRLVHAAPPLRGRSGAWCDGTSGDAAELDAHAGELIDLLAERLGDRCVGRLATEAAHLPERAFRLEPARDVARRTQRASRLSESGRLEAAIAVDRPSRLLAVPEPIAVEPGPGGLPARMLRRGIAHDLRQAVGPERIGLPWWEGGDGADPGGASAAARDYYRVRDAAGQWWWIFRAVEADRAGHVGDAGHGDRCDCAEHAEHAEHAERDTMRTEHVGSVATPWFLHGMWC